MTTLAPRAANASTAAFPMPAAPPVTNATRPFMSFASCFIVRRLEQAACLARLARISWKNTRIPRGAAGPREEFALERGGCAVNAAGSWPRLVPPRGKGRDLRDRAAPSGSPAVARGYRIRRARPLPSPPAGRARTVRPLNASRSEAPTAHDMGAAECSVRRPSGRTKNARADTFLEVRRAHV